MAGTCPVVVAVPVNAKVFPTPAALPPSIISTPVTEPLTAVTLAVAFFPKAGFEESNFTLKNTSVPIPVP